MSKPTARQLVLRLVRSLPQPVQFWQLEVEAIRSGVSLKAATAIVKEQLQALIDGRVVEPYYALVDGEVKVCVRPPVETPEDRAEQLVLQQRYERMQRVRQRLKELSREAQRRPCCPKCMAEMRERVSPFGPFLSCSRWPQCDGKRSVRTGQPVPPAKAATAANHPCNGCGECPCQCAE